jgi:hypothetical protein
VSTRPEDVQEAYNAAMRDLDSPQHEVNDADDARTSVPDIPAPVLDPTALYGPIGDYVASIEPTTEAHPAAMLASAITAVGALVGRGPYMRLDGATHHARCYTLLCGPTAGGKKSTAMRWGAHNLLDAIDADFAKTRVRSGLVSGEGILFNLRDSTPERDGPNGKPTPGDAGVADKRLLACEDELGGVFSKLDRPGNSLSSTLRALWDGGTQESLTRSEGRGGMIATDPHFCMIGCVTPADLHTSLKAVEVLNGLLNRYLIVWTNSVRLLPFGGAPAPDFAARCDDVARAVHRTRVVGEVTFSDDARALWAPIYPALSRPEASGVLAAILARGATHVLRIALLYAALDGSRTIAATHLSAALAFWRYCESSTRFVYAKADTLSPRAAKLLAALRNAGAQGMSRSQIRTAAGSNNIPEAEITGALTELRAASLVDRLPPVATKGRPAEVWRHLHFRSTDTAVAPDGSEGWEKREEREEREESSRDSADHRLSSQSSHPSHPSHPAHPAHPAVAPIDDAGYWESLALDGAA